MEQVGCNCDPEGGCGCFEQSEEDELDEESDQETAAFN